MAGHGAARQGTARQGFMNTKALILLLLLLLCVNAFGTEPAINIAPVRQMDSDEFIGVVVSITADPQEGQWLRVHVTYYYVHVWYRNDVKMPMIGATIRILAIYYDNFRYPSRNVSIYKGLSWEAIE